MAQGLKRQWPGHLGECWRCGAVTVQDGGACQGCERWIGGHRVSLGLKATPARVGHNDDEAIRLARVDYLAAGLGYKKSWTEAERGWIDK
jgi:hypothetical protein